MICRTCGRIINNEEANFCEYCGAPQGTRIPEIEKHDTVVELSSNINSKPIRFGEWMISMAIVFAAPFIIPFFGFGISAFFLIYWGFINKQVSETKRNWARAMMIFGVGFIVMMIASLGMLSSMAENPEFMDMFNSLLAK